MELEKITIDNEATTRRWYDDACGTALAMELLGERWSLLIVRELMFGPRRFGEVRGALAGLSANVLTQRLDRLETVGILARHKLPSPAFVHVYELTALGYSAEVAIQELGRWATQSPLHDPTLAFSAAAAMLSLRTMIDRTRSGAFTATVGFRFDRETFVATVDANGIAIARQDPADADVIFETDPPTLAALVYGGRPIADAQAAGALTLKGDARLAEMFVTLFPLPAKLA